MVSNLRMHPQIDDFMPSYRCSLGLSWSSLLRSVPRPPERPVLPSRLPSQRTWQVTLEHAHQLVTSLQKGPSPLQTPGRITATFVQLSSEYSKDAGVLCDGLQGAGWARGGHIPALTSGRCHPCSLSAPPRRRLPAAPGSAGPSLRAPASHSCHLHVLLLSVLAAYFIESCLLSSPLTVCPSRSTVSRPA